MLTMVSLEDWDLPVRDYVAKHGPVKEVGYDPQHNALVFFLPKSMLFFSRESEKWSPPIGYLGEFVASVSVENQLAVVTTAGIFRIDSDKATAFKIFPSTREGYAAAIDHATKDQAIPRLSIQANPDPDYHELGDKGDASN